MSFVRLDKSVHSSAKLKPITGYAHASKQALARLLPEEMPRAGHEFPIVFARQGDLIFPAALLGLSPDINQFVGKDGRWLAGYVPAILQCFPFSLTQDAGHEDKGRFVPMLDESALSDVEGVPLYTDAGELAAEPRLKISTLLKSVAQLGAGAKALAALEEMGVIVPWDISLRVGASGSIVLKGFFRADETALKTLADEKVLELWHSGVLPMLYAHWFSLSRFSALGATLMMPEPSASADD